MSTDRPTPGDAAPAGALPAPGPSHRCRRDDPMYPDTWAWWQDHQGRMPITAAVALSRLRRERGMTFGKAFQHLVDMGALALLDDDRA